MNELARRDRVMTGGRTAHEQLATLDKKTLALVASFLDELDGCDDPGAPLHAKKLQGMDDDWRWRVGTYCILGTIDDGHVIIELLHIGHRSDVRPRLQHATRFTLPHNSASLDEHRV